MASAAVHVLDLIGETMGNVGVGEPGVSFLEFLRQEKVRGLELHENENSWN
jgi:hypothetical protein